MFSVIFEVNPQKEKFDQYLELAKHLKPILQDIDGFIDNERFESQTNPGWLLSHSTWRDEKSVVRWRTTEEHHFIQEQGRNGILADYHLRVGDVMKDNHPPENIPVKELRFDATEIGEAKVMSLIEITPLQGVPLPNKDELFASIGAQKIRDQILEYDLFSSIYNPGKVAILISWKDKEMAALFSPLEIKEALSTRNRTVRIIRDYGMFDRREAPQYYPDAKGRETKHATQKCPVNH